MVITHYLPVMTSHLVLTSQRQEPSPISAEQEESRNVSCALGTVLDHFYIEAVIVHCIVRDDHGPPTVLLYHSGFREERASPERWQ